MKKDQNYITGCGIIILAAGSSSRLGKPKQLLPYKGRSLLRQMVETAISTGLSPVLVVLGAYEQTISSTLAGLPVVQVYNQDWHKGMSTSIKAGLAKALELEPELNALIFTVCDQPMVTSSLLLELIKTQQSTGKPIVASSYKETRGIPALFYRAFFPALQELTGDAGAKKLIINSGDQVATVDFPEGHIDIDINTDYNSLIHPEK